MEQRYYEEYFDVEDRHWWFLGRREVILRLLETSLPTAGRPSRVLDVGTGTGTMLTHLARFGEAEGVDVEEEAVRLSHRRGATAVRHYDGERLPYDECIFDLVTALDVIEHVDDDEAILREMRRVTRPGGHVLVTVPAFPFLWGGQDEISHHRRRYVRQELRAKLEHAGLQVERVSYFNMLLFPPIAAIRLVRRRRLAATDAHSDFDIPTDAINGLLARMFAAEARVVSKVDLPFGVSLIALARRQDDAKPRRRTPGPPG